MSIGSEKKEEYAIRFGRRLDEALRDAGINQAEAGRRLEVPPSRISEYVRGVVLPPVSTIDRIISVLDLDPMTLFPEWMMRSAWKSAESGTAVPGK